MKVLVNHLTRMRGDRICVAAIDLDTQRHVRPTTRPDDVLTSKLLAGYGGSLELGSIVDLGTPLPVPQNPETEDHLVESSVFESTGRVSHREITDALGSVRSESIKHAFGSKLEPYKKTYVTPKHTGEKSLGVVELREGWADLDIEEHANGKRKLRFVKHSEPWTGREWDNLPVTSSQFFDFSGPEPMIDDNKVVQVAELLKARNTVFLMLGLTHDLNDFHWLQLNGLYFMDEKLNEVFAI